MNQNKKFDEIRILLPLANTTLLLRAAGPSPENKTHASFVGAIVEMIDKNKTTMTTMMHTKNRNKMNVLLTVFE